MPSIIIIDGLNGAGKSTVAKMLSSKLKRTALISYDSIKRLMSDFTPNEEYHRIANHVVRSMAKEYLRHGVNVIIETYIPSRKIAMMYTGLARRSDVTLHHFKLEAPLDVRYERILQRPLVPGVKKKQSKEKVAVNDEQYFLNNTSRATVIETNVRTPEQVARIILKELH